MFIDVALRRKGKDIQRGPPSYQAPLADQTMLTLILF